VEGSHVCRCLPFRISPSYYLQLLFAPNNFHLPVSIHYLFLSCKVPLPKYGLAYHAFRPPRPRAGSWCSCGKRGPKDQSLAFGHLGTSDNLPCLLYSLCHCKWMPNTLRWTSCHRCAPLPNFNSFEPTRGSSRPLYSCGNSTDKTLPSYVTPTGMLSGP
jgi:hypothetical protein